MQEFWGSLLRKGTPVGRLGGYRKDASPGRLYKKRGRVMQVCFEFALLF